MRIGRAHLGELLGRKPQIEGQLQGWQWIGVRRDKAQGRQRKGMRRLGGYLTSGLGEKSAAARASLRQCPLAAVAHAIDLDDRAVVHQSVHSCHGHGAGEKTFSHSLNGWFEVTNRDFRLQCITNLHSTEVSASSLCK